MSDNNIIPMLKQEDIDTLDTDKLRRDMLRGMYALEAGLFSQVGFEFNRVEGLRDIITSIEEDIFSQDIEEMGTAQKIAIYKLASNNLANSMNFLQTLHKNVTSGLDTINDLDRIKTAKVDDSDQVAIEKIKNLIMRKIKEKEDTNE